MIKCQKCGHENLDDSLFCNSCCEKLVQKEKYKCSKCGREFSGENAYCNGCGAKLVYAKEDEAYAIKINKISNKSEQTQANSNKITTIRIAITNGLLILATFLMMISVYLPSVKAVGFGVKETLGLSYLFKDMWKNIDSGSLSNFSEAIAIIYFCLLFYLDKELAKIGVKDDILNDKKFNEFKRVFNLSRTFSSYKELSDFADNNYSDVIVGSDQLWLPVNVVSDYYTLNWVSNNVNKISYATSFGISKIPSKYTEMYNKFLNHINYLSVREDVGVNLIKEIANKDATLVCDPTILLTRNEWEEIISDERIINDDYIFCYFLGSNIEHRKFVENLKKITGYKIVSLNHCDEYVKYSDKFADYTPYDVGPSEFVNLIKNAKYVCTDSFHGTVFSILFNKEFYTFERFKSNAKMSTNSRIYSLLKKTKLEDRLLYIRLRLRQRIFGKAKFCPCFALRFIQIFCGGDRMLFLSFVI